MMTSAVRTTDFRRGFTLIEIVMVLAIAAVVTGGAVSMMIYSSDERALRDISGEVELLAKRARTIAILQQTPYALEFRPGQVNLMPFAEAGRDEKSRPIDLPPDPNANPDDIKKRQPVRETLAVQNEMALSVRRWNTDGWIPMTKGSLQIWRFDPDGLCEPISIRYALDQSWAEDSFHPLTATISDSQLEAK